MNTQTQYVSGLVGVVLIPDANFVDEVRQLAQQTPEMTFQTQAPHLSLYHVDLDNAPLSEVNNVLRAVHQQSFGAPLILDQIGIFGGRFVFWDAQMAPWLRAAHESALGLSKYRNLQGASSSAGLGLSLSKREMENVEKFGYALVGDSFRPHVTIGYYDRDISTYPFEGSRVSTGRVAKIGLFEIGEQGRIGQEIVSSVREAQPDGTL